MRTEHEVFNKPVKVNLTIEDQPTPTSYERHKKRYKLGATMPMWRVQTEGYLTHPGQLVGVVSRDAGFFDSPDVEWISAGVNTKGPKAVAIGRHGNFFHWGFAAAPNYMTDQAKDVFCNSLHYIAKFEGMTPVARKVPGTMIRTSVDDAIESMTEEGHARNTKHFADFVRKIEELKSDVQKRIDAGEEVSESEKRMAEMPASEVPAPSMIAQAERLIPAELVKEMGGDPAKLTAYLKRVKPYLRPDGWHKLTVDEELMELGIANNDPSLLTKAIEMLTAESDKQKQLGQTLLTRYTDQSFGTHQEWSDWLVAKQDKLFFTEAGGYKWLVNERKASVSKKRSNNTADKNATDKNTTNKSNILAKATARTPFVSAMSIEPEGDEYVLNVNVDILDGWHAYDIVQKSSAYNTVQLELTLTEGVRQVSDWKRPDSTPSIDDAGVTTYTGNINFRCRLAVDETTSASEVSCAVSYQVCDRESCKPPGSVMHKLSIKR